jgi:hypothetical protein
MHQAVFVAWGPPGGPTRALQADSLKLDQGNFAPLKAPARLKRVGREMRMLVENADDRTPADRGLLRIIARAHDVQLRLTQNVDLTGVIISRRLVRLEPKANFSRTLKRQR